MDAVADRRPRPDARVLTSAAPSAVRPLWGAALGTAAGLAQLVAAIPALNGIAIGDRGYWVKMLAVQALLYGTALLSVSLCLAVLRIRGWFTWALGLCAVEGAVGGLTWHAIGGNGHVGRFGIIVVLVAIEVAFAAACLPSRSG